MRKRLLKSGPFRQIESSPFQTRRRCFVDTNTPRCQDKARLFSQNMLCIFSFPIHSPYWIAKSPSMPHYSQWKRKSERGSSREIHMSLEEVCREASYRYPRKQGNWISSP